MVRENHKMVREMSGKRQGILWGLMAGHPVWTNTGILIIGPLGTNLREIWNEIPVISFKKSFVSASMC